MASERPRALAEAVAIYLERGELEQASRLVRELSRIPGYEVSRELLVALYAATGEYGRIPALVDEAPEHRWSPDVAATIARAYDELDRRSPPLLLAKTDHGPNAQVSADLSLYAAEPTRFPPKARRTTTN